MQKVYTQTKTQKTTTTNREKSKLSVIGQKKDEIGLKFNNKEFDYLEEL